MEDREQKGRGAGCVIAGVVLILLPVLYILGLGPAVWLEGRCPAISGTVGFLYYPLQFLANNSEPMRRVLRWYVEFWA